MNHLAGVRFWLTSFWLLLFIVLQDLIETYLTNPCLIADETT